MTEPKTALVTGANKGIGREIARRLAADGYRVWLGCRDHERGEAAAAELRAQGLDVRQLDLDVTSDALCATAAQALARQTDRLDVLVNNAGVALELRAPPSEEPVDQIKAIYEVNVFGPIRVTQAFLPLLKASAAARVVMMSSGLGSLGTATNPDSPFYGTNYLGYNSSKSALNGVTVAFAKALGPLGIKVNAACPGYVATDLNGHSGYRTVEQGAEIAVRLATLDAAGPTAGYFNEDGPLPW